MKYPIKKVLEYKSHLIADTVLCRFIIVPSGYTKMFPINQVQSFLNELWQYCVEKRLPFPIPEMNAECLSCEVSETFSMKMILWNQIIKSLKVLSFCDRKLMQEDSFFCGYLGLSAPEWENFKNPVNQSKTALVIIKAMANLGIETT